MHLCIGYLILGDSYQATYQIQIWHLLNTACNLFFSCHVMYLCIKTRAQPLSFSWADTYVFIFTLPIVLHYSSIVYFAS